MEELVPGLVSSYMPNEWNVVCHITLLFCCRDSFQNTTIPLNKDSQVNSIETHAMICVDIYCSNLMFTLNVSDNLVAFESVVMKWVT